MTFRASLGLVFLKKGSNPTFKLGLLWYNSAIVPDRNLVRFGPSGRGYIREEY